MKHSVLASIVLLLMHHRCRLYLTRVANEVFGCQWMTVAIGIPHCRGTSRSVMSDQVKVAPYFFFASLPFAATSSRSVLAFSSSSGTDCRKSSAYCSSSGRVNTERRAAPAGSPDRAHPGRFVMNRTAIRRAL